MAAFLAAVDPFHDRPIEQLEGWPDLETAPSVVRRINGSFTVRAVEDGGSMLIMTYPILNELILHSISRKNAVVTLLNNGVSTNTTLAPGVIYNYTAAQSAATLQLTGAGSPVAGDFFVDPDYFEDGPVRCIGYGVEVHDVTAELYKQGTLTVFEVPQAVGERENVVVRAQTIGGVAYIQTNVDAVPINKFPDTLNQMLLYPTTRQWEAKDGAYVVVPFTGQPNYPGEAEYRTPYMYGSTASTDTPNSLNTSSKFLGTYASGSVNGDNLEFLANSYAPMHSKGIYLSGLNANSTFTINFRLYLESFPQCDSTLVTLARPSAKHDPVALAMISAAVKKLPVGVMVGDNPDGEWFWDALQAALPFIGGAASVFFPEFSPLIGMATSAGVAALEGRKPKKAQAKPKTKPLPPIPAGKKPPVPPKPRKKG